MLEKSELHFARSKGNEKMFENSALNLSKILKQAKEEVGYMDHIAAGHLEPHARTQRKAATGGYMDLRKLGTPSLLESNGNFRSLIGQAGTSGNSKTLDAKLIESSLAAKAGARVIIAEERPGPSKGDVVLLYRDSGAFIVSEPAQFAAVDDGDDATNSPLPIVSSSITWADAPSSSFSTTITRRQQKDAGYDLEATLMQSIIAGLAREADRVLLAAILAKNPGLFSLGAAAARGLEFAELRALIGTNGTGAAVHHDGELRAVGIRGELTNQTTNTIIGSFARSAIAIHPMLNVFAERLNVNGDTKITVFANMLGLVPDISAFWTVSA